MFSPHPHRFHYRLFVLLFLGIICLFGLYLVKNAQQQGLFMPPHASRDERAVVMPTTQPEETAIFTLKPRESLQNLTSGQWVTVDLYTNTQGRSVAGFDALIGVSGVTYNEVDASALMFDIVHFTKPTHLTLSAVKKLSITKDIALSPASPAATFRLKITSPGTMTMKVFARMPPESSKLVLTDPAAPAGLRKVSAMGE